MGIKRPLDFRFPELEHSHTQGGSHLNALSNTWETVVDVTNKRGTMQVRFIVRVPSNYFSYMRITLDGVTYPIDVGRKATFEASWIFDFNESIKIEHKSTAATVNRVEYTYCEYRP